MRIVIVASSNPVKIACARSGFARMFPGETFDVRGVSVPSGVSHQPMGDAETILGARSRTSNARAAVPLADYWVGIEGGCEVTDGVMSGFAWVVIATREREGRSRTATFEIPPSVAALVSAGVELGHADDQVFGRTNSKEGNGAVGLLTADAVDRVALYEPAVILALIPFRNPQLFPAGPDNEPARPACHPDTSA
jgi:inosine/xanthosine triphosphatase